MFGLQVLGNGYTSASTTASVIGPVRAPDSVCLVKGMSKLAMSLRRIPLELDGRAAMKVLRMGLGNQVARVHAFGIGAGMTDFKPASNTAVGQLITETMRENRSSATSTKPELAIAKRDATFAEPGPALVVGPLVHLCPKSIRLSSNHLLRSMICQWIALALPSPVVHLAPTTFLGRLCAVRNGTVHV